MHAVPSEFGPDLLSEIVNFPYYIQLMALLWTMVRRSLANVLQLQGEDQASQESYLGHDAHTFGHWKAHHSNFNCL